MTFHKREMCRLYSKHGKKKIKKFCKRISLAEKWYTYRHKKYLKKFYKVFKTVTLFQPTSLKRIVFFIVADLLIITLSVWIAFLLRFDGTIPQLFLPALALFIALFVLVKIPLFTISRLYLVPWRYFSIKEFGLIAIVSLIGTLLIACIAILLRGSFPPFPRSILGMEFLLTTLGILTLRSSKRLFLEHLNANALGEPTLLVGLSDSTDALIRMLRRTPDRHPVAILDLETTKIGMRVQGLPVISWDDLPALSLTTAIITQDGCDPRTLDAVFERLIPLGISDIKISTPLGDSQNHPELKEITIEDLLARHPKDLDRITIASFIKDKTILITGAAGSIGSEIVRQTLSYGASKIIALDHSEYNLYALLEELQDSRIIPVMQSVVHRDHLSKTFATYRPTIVIHAAAYKHVPLAEANPQETIVNNIIGTKNTIDMALHYDVQTFLLISTDKAVRPTNVMGATKRICELYAQNINAHQKHATTIVAVRFGNVLGSSGSVIPKFRSQIEAGGPVTVTHPEITRYFMMIPEACQLVLQAAAIGQGGEIFILDMGEPVKIVDLAKRMIELSGRGPIPIVFSGLRPGEKLYEELLINDAEAKTIYSSIFVAPPTHYPIDQLQHDIQTLTLSADPYVMLQHIVPEAKLSPQPHP